MSSLPTRLTEAADDEYASGTHEELIALLREAATALAALVEERDAARYLILNCGCTVPMAIRLDSIDHGLRAGWKCGACGQTQMLSGMALATEGLAAHPERPSVAGVARQDVKR